MSPEQHYALAERVAKLEVANGHDTAEELYGRVAELETKVALQQVKLDAMSKGIWAILLFIALEVLRGFFARGT